MNGFWSLCKRLEETYLDVIKGMKYLPGEQRRRYRPIKKVKLKSALHFEILRQQNKLCDDILYCVKVY